MAKKCAECGEKLKLTNKHWQYIDGVFTEFCSDEHRAAYEGRAALEAQSKPQPATVVEKKFPKWILFWILFFPLGGLFLFVVGTVGGYIQETPLEKDWRRLREEAGNCEDHTIIERYRSERC